MGKRPRRHEERDGTSSFIRRGNPHTKKQMKIAIDIGHANRTGSTGNGMEEHAVCSVLATHLHKILTANGHDVSLIDFPNLTNAADLAATVRAINAGGYDCSLSLHADASDNAEAKGGHVCFYPGSGAGKTLAEDIASPLAELLPGRAETVVPRKNLYILRKTACPAVLVECGFITNQHDANLMAHSPQGIARAIAHGVDTFAARKAQ